MILDILFFELKFWKKRAITYVFPFLVFLISLLAFTIENIQLGSDIAYRNSPVSLLMIYFLFFLMLPLFVNSFVSSGVTRDYEYKFDQILYSFPLSRFQLLMGRFAGGCMVVSFMFIGILLADIIAPFAPWTKEGFLAKPNYLAHAMNYFLVALPNIFIIGSILFLISSWTKNINYSFLGAIFLVVFYLTSLTMLGKIDNKWVMALSDPFGFLPIELQTKKWTAFERNHSLFLLDYKFLLNRLVWMIVAIGFWLVAFKSTLKFSFGKKKKKENNAKKEFYVAKTFTITKDYSWSYRLNNILFQAKTDALNLVKSPVFFVIVGLIVMIYSMVLMGMINDDQTDEIATTYNTIMFLGAVKMLMKFAIVFFAGILIWKEREFKMSDILDSLPSSPLVIYLGKLLSIVFLNVALNAIITITGVLYQLGHRIMNIEWGLYASELFVFDLFNNICLAILAMLFQIIFNNKYLAYFISILLLVLESFLWSWLEIDTNMVSISPKLPSVIYSDFYGYGPYLVPKLAFMGYWGILYAFLAAVSILFLVRGHLNSFKERMSEAKERLGHIKWSVAILLILFASYGGWLYYQTMVLNPFDNTKVANDKMAYYEKQFKKYTNHPIPRIVDFTNTIDLYPEDRKIQVKGKMTMVNTTDTMIDKLYVNNSKRFPFMLTVSHARKTTVDHESNVDFETYVFDKPLAIGDTITIDYSRTQEYKGVENELENTRLLPNGTFLDVSELAPTLGYMEDNEISDKSEREKRGLDLKAENMPKLERNCGKACRQDYLGGYSDWTKIYTTVSTSSDQMAIAPGSLVKKWTASNRNYFEYHLDQPSKFFFSIVSGRFEVMRDSTNGVLCEVYYHKNHSYNVKEMMKALKKSIAYYSSHFGPYYHREARIIEFPRFSSFAQAFPGTMPYSESIGFTSNLVDNPKDINQIFHVVAHEMAHQWWAHQLIGARMQGATVLSESLAEYSSLKLLEKEYGIDMTAKFLKDANNQYIFGRARETKKESSLLQVDNQPYIHYQKGSVVLFGIQQIIGEQAMNKVLHSLNESFAYKNPPYPTSYELYDRLYQAMPDSFKYLAKDGIERIIVYKTNIEDAKVKKVGDHYETTLSFSINKNSSDPNAKQTKDLDKILIGQSKEEPINDYFDIALFEDNDSKSRYGKYLSSQRFKINKSKNQVVVKSHIKPNKVVIDPYFIYIHKDPEENIKKL